MMDYALELISNTISDPTKSLESWVEGKTLTVMYDDPNDGRRQYVKLRFVRLADFPSAADMMGAPA